MKTLIAFWSILRKDIKTYYLKPPNISWGFIFPISWTLMQFMRAPGALDIRTFLPGLMAMCVLFGTTSMLAVTITFERSGRSFDRLLLAPIALSTMVAAKITGAILFGSINAFIPVVFALFFINLSGINWALVLLAVVLIAITSTLMGLMIAVSAKQVFEAQTLSNFFRFPMLFLCGLFTPVSALPVFLRPISYALPLTYGADILSGAMADAGTLPPLLCIAALIAFGALLFLICHKSINCKWIL